MTHGPHGDLVDAFLAEVRRASPDDWRDFARVARPTQASLDATRAVRGLRLSAATLASVDSAALKTYRAVLPSLDDTAGPGRGADTAGAPTGCAGTPWQACRYGRHTAAAGTRARAS